MAETEKVIALTHNVDWANMGFKIREGQYK
jgi:hypothetical protein